MSREKVCKFCEDLAYTMAVAKLHEENGVKQHLKVALYEYGTQDRKIKYKSVHKAKQLNYCPTCGTKLRKGY